MQASKRLRLASIFAGCGGADLGIKGGFEYLGQSYSETDIEIIHASDIDVDAVATYNKNFENSALAEVADVKTLNFSGMEMDILVGGFPCQSFSTVNPTKDPDDDRGQLYRELVRLGDQARPKVIIGENVKGFLTLNKGRYFAKLKSSLEEIGYSVFHKVLAAHHFGVPQKRERVFIVAIRNDLGIDFEFPNASVPVVEGDFLFTPLGSVLEEHTSVPDKYYFSERAVAGVKAAKPNMKRAVAQDPKLPCLTITSHLAKASLNSRDPVLLVDDQAERYRRFTPREASRIQGFPENFEWPSSDPKAYKQIGNAISPIVMWHLINAVKDQITR